MANGFMARFKGKTFTPTGSLSQFGAGGAAAGENGNISLQVSATGVNPGATGADKVLAVYALPANSFDAAGRTLAIVAAGSFGATANSKRIKIIIGAAAPTVGATVSGGTTIADTGAVTTNGGGWQLAATVSKYGAGGSNTQLAVHNQAQVGAAVAALVSPQALTLTENAVINVVVTGNAATAATDIVFNWLEVNAAN
ncbi:hypothetical protein [Bradyrhizobium sp. ORS 86]|uniref:hypothetical protein n=1 Tax=Bradyrhizobium sp. ORS 86 TaxID=1685970 RepID=UPI00388E15DD